MELGDDYVSITFNTPCKGCAIDDDDNLVASQWFSCGGAG